jgi:hypothetical protein
MRCFLSPATAGSIAITGLFCLFAMGVKAQSYEPSIVILTPKGRVEDKKVQKEIRKHTELIAGRSEEMVRRYEQELEDSKDREENIRLMLQRQAAFSKNLDYYTVIPSVAEGYLQYRLFERFKNLLVFAVNEQSDGTSASLKEIGGKYQTQYVLNFSNVHSFVEGGKKQVAITVQFYDCTQQKIMLEREYTGDDENPGFEFTCEEGTLFCGINNALAPALSAILKIIATDSPTIQKEKRLAKERAEKLTALYAQKAPANITQLITEKGSGIPVKGYYQGIMNEAGNKFIGFFALDTKSADFKSINTKEDRSVDMTLGDGQSFGDTPGIYAYVVIGIRQDSTWYFKKDKVSYFNASRLEEGRQAYFNKLQQWSFFEENTSNVSTGFWETYFFRKIEDKRLDPDWEKYGATIWASEEMNNRPYIGMYELIADELKEQEDQKREAYNQQYAAKTVKPFFEKLKGSSTRFTDYKLINDNYILICPPDRSVILCPVEIIDAKNVHTLQFFVFIPGTTEVYEWTRFKPLEAGQKKITGSDIIDQLERYTTWNFSIDYVSDPNFWQQQVLHKENGTYLYLKKP